MIRDSYDSQELTLDPLFDQVWLFVLEDFVELQILPDFLGAPSWHERDPSLESYPVYFSDHRRGVLEDNNSFIVGESATFRNEEQNREYDFVGVRYDTGSTLTLMST